jgi:hypothetical protein
LELRPWRTGTLTHGAAWTMTKLWWRTKGVFRCRGGRLLRCRPDLQEVRHCASATGTRAAPGLQIR